MENNTKIEIDVGNILNDGEWTTYEKVILALASLAFIVDGLATQVIAISIPAMMKEWHVGREVFSNVTAIGLIGIAIGTISAGALADRIGRKTMMLASILVFGFATMAIAQVQDLNTLLLLRFIDGLGLGGTLPTTIALIAEFTPTRRRSRAVQMAMISISVGNLACGLIGAAMLPTLGWRTLFLFIGCLSVLIAALLFFVLPESLRFLLRKPQQHDHLRRLLVKLHVPVPVDAKLVDRTKAAVRGSFRELFLPGVTLTTLGLWGGFFFCFLAAYTSLSWIPTLLASHGYAVGISSATLSTYSVGGILGTLVAAKCVELFGSKRGITLLAVAGALIAIGLTFMPLDPAASVIPVMLGFASLGLCISGLTSCLYALAAFAYPPIVKATGVGAAGGVGRLGAIVSAYAAVAMIGLGGNAFFLLVAGAALLALGSVLLVKTHVPSDRAFIKKG